MPTKSIFILSSLISILKGFFFSLKNRCHFSHFNTQPSTLPQMQSHQEFLYLHVSKGKCKRCVLHDIITFYKFIMEFCNLWRYFFSQTEPIVESFIYASLQLCVSFWAFLYLSDHLYFYDVYPEATLEDVFILYLCYRKMQFVQNFNFLGWTLEYKGDFKVV